MKHFPFLKISFLAIKFKFEDYFETVLPVNILSSLKKKKKEKCKSEERKQRPLEERRSIVRSMCRDTTSFSQVVARLIFVLRESAEVPRPRKQPACILYEVICIERDHEVWPINYRVSVITATPNEKRQ